MGTGVGQKRVVAAGGMVWRMSGVGRRSRLPDQQKGRCLVFIPAELLAEWLLLLLLRFLGYA